jgi:hypothetical protein
MGVNWLVLREDEFFIRDQVLVAPCLSIANPFVRSMVPESRSKEDL